MYNRRRNRFICLRFLAVRCNAWQTDRIEEKLMLNVPCPLLHCYSHKLLKLGGYGNGNFTSHNFRVATPHDLLMSHFPSKIRCTRSFPMPNKPTKQFGEMQWPSKNHFLLPLNCRPTACFTSHVRSVVSNIDLHKSTRFKKSKNLNFRWHRIEPTHFQPLAEPWT